jgi:transcriptional regulator with XRE-family HTH domain
MRKKATYWFLFSRKETNMFPFYKKQRICFLGRMMSKVLEQLKQRRKQLKLTQEQMMLRVGMSRQQYQRLESRGNPTLENLELIAKGLKLELMLIPQEKLQAVKAILAGKPLTAPRGASQSKVQQDEDTHASDPWKNLLVDDS